MSCIICGDPKTDRCHIKTRGSGGTDDDWNLLRMCRGHHAVQHQLGFFEFVKSYPEVGDALKEKGWEFENRFGIWKLVRKETEEDLYPPYGVKK